MYQLKGWLSHIKVQHLKNMKLYQHFHFSHCHIFVDKNV
jgi:hypothetical protein